jgi:hypothetical protein
MFTVPNAPNKAASVGVVIQVPRNLGGKTIPPAA